MEVVAEIRDAHDARVLYSSLAPDGELVVTAAADENLKFWKIWDLPKVKKTKSGSSTSASSGGPGLLTIR